MLRPTMGTPQTPVGESATEEVLEDADLIVDESADALLVDAEDDEAFDSRETNALPRVDAARALSVLRVPRPTPTRPPELPPAKVDEAAPLPDATEKVSAESILGVANALLAEADVEPTEGPVATAVARPRSVPPPPRRPALPSSPTPFSVALPIRIETRPLPTAGRVETLPEPAELDAWVPPTLPPRSQAIDPTAQVATVPLARYWPLFAAAAFVGVALVGVASLGMRPHAATLASAIRADEALLRGEREPAAPVEPAGPPRPTTVATTHAPMPMTRPATMAVAGRAPMAPVAKGAAKPAPTKPATKGAPKAAPKVTAKAPAPKAQAAPTRHK
jgi:hypothetical protein